MASAPTRAGLDRPLLAPLPTSQPGFIAAERPANEVERRSDSARFLTWAQSAARSGDRRVAHWLLVEALALDPTNREAWLWRGAVAAERAEAIHCLTRALELEPGEARASRGLAVLLAQEEDETRPARLRAERIGPAQASAAQSTAVRPTSPSAGSWNRAALLRQLGLTALIAALLFGTPSPTAPDLSQLVAFSPLELTIGSASDVTPTAMSPTAMSAPAAMPQAPSEVPAPAPSAPAPIIAEADSNAVAATVERDAPAVAAADASAQSTSVAELALAPSAASEEPAASGAPVASALPASPSRPVAPAPAPDSRLPTPDSPSLTPDPQPPTPTSPLFSQLFARTLVDDADRAEQEAASSPDEPAGGRLPEGSWVAVQRPTGLWSRPDSGGEQFREARPGDRFQVARSEIGARVYVFDHFTNNYAYLNLRDVAPAESPSRTELRAIQKGRPLPPPPAPAESQPWLAVHRATWLWSGSDANSQAFRMAQPGEHFQLARPQQGDRLYVWDPEAKNYAYIVAADVGPANKPSKPARQPETVAQPEPTLAPAPSVAGPGGNVFWSGTARVTMYTCVELGGCNRTASGIWPYEGVVAVDPRIIPLGSKVWIEGLGHFLAADTGSAILGNRIDVYSLSYPRAIQWGVQYRTAAAYHE